MIHPKRILVSPLRFIGDGILTIPLLRALRAHYENAQIDLLLPRHMVNLFERCPYINEILEETDSRSAVQSAIKARDYELAILMRRSVSQALMMRIAGVKYLVGYDEQRFPPPLSYQRWGWFLNDALPFPPLDTDIPQVKTYLNLLSPLGITHGDESLELWADEADKLKVAALFNQAGIDAGKPLAMIHGTSASREKALAIEKFVPTLQAMTQAGFQVVAVGTITDKPFYNELARLANVPLFNLCGETTLRQSFALMLKLQLLVSLDSAPVHMAVAAGVPHMVGIYGATNEKQWRPYPYDGQFTPVFNASLNCRPCVPKLCSHNRCREDLTGAQILQAVESHLSQICLPDPVCQ